jgi:hypothetical protein
MAAVLSIHSNHLKASASKLSGYCAKLIEEKLFVEWDSICFWIYLSP